MLIQISHDEPDAAFKRVKTLVAASKLRDPDFQRIDPIVERGEYTCIADEDGPDATVVLKAVQAELSSQRDVPAGYGMTIFGEIYDL